MNILAGILIGILNETWSGWLIWPGIWALAYTLLKTFTRKKEAEHLAAAKSQARFGLSHVQVFYIIEFLTTLTVTLIISVLIGIMKTVF